MTLAEVERPPCDEDAEAVEQPTLDEGQATEEPPKADAVTGEIVAAGEVLPAELPDERRIAPKALGAIPYADGYWRLAQRISHTELVPDGMRGRSEAVVACFFKGYEMGMGPMQSLDSFDVIKGKVAMKPEAMRALIMSRGHLFVLRDGVKDGKRFCEAEVRRSDWPDEQPNEVYLYDWDDATLAGLVSKDNWKKNPRAMLDARATGGAARRYFADVIQGMSYTTGEIEDFDS